MSGEAVAVPGASVALVVRKLVPRYHVAAVIPGTLAVGSAAFAVIASSQPGVLVAAVGYAVALARSCIKGVGETRRLRALARRANELDWQLTGDRLDGIDPTTHECYSLVLPPELRDELLAVPSARLLPSSSG
jgi:hypothetical protein